jgi:hypothetical protein
MRILFVSANSADAYLDIEREQRTLVQLAEKGKHFLKLLPAAQYTDLEHELSSKNGKNRKPFDVLHFSGHGERAEGILLRRSEEDPEPEPLSDEQFETLLGEAKKAGLKLVVLNACETEPLVEKGSGLVDEIIGTKWPVKDRVAWNFTTKFYEELNNNATVAEAFQSATDPDGPYLRPEKESSIRLPSHPGEAKIEGLGAFYDKYYGDYIDKQIEQLIRDKRLNNYVFFGLIAVAVCVWVVLFHNGDYGAPERAFWPNLKAALGAAFYPGSGDTGVDLFSMQGLWERVEKLEAFAPVLIAFFQRRVFSHISPKIDGLKRLRDSIRNWENLPEEDQKAVQSVMHASLKESLNK